MKAWKLVTMLDFWGVLPLALLAPACTDARDDGPGTGPEETTADAADDGGPDPLAAPDPSEGFQLRISADVRAGSERTVCSFFRVPAGGFDAVAFEHRISGPAHHFLVYQTQLTPERVSDYPDVFDCSGPADFGMEVGSVLYGAQDRTSAYRMPAGVASRASADQILLVELHMINGGEVDDAADGRLNVLYATEPVAAAAGGLFFVPVHTWIPPLQSASITMRCELPKDIRLFRVGSHMHRRGVGFRATVEGGALAAPELIHQSFAYDTAVPRYFDEPMLLQAGQIVEFTCDYENHDPVGVTAGFSADTDEMCILVGQYFTDDGVLLTTDQEWCRMLPGTQGTGTGTCSEVGPCIEGSINDTPTEGQPAVYQQCGLATCPGDGLGLFDALGRCRDASCRGICSTGNDIGERYTALYSTAECLACEARNCAAERDACAAHVCP